MQWNGIHNLDLSFIENKQTTVEYELYTILNPKYSENNKPEGVTDYTKAMAPVYKQIRLNDPSFVWDLANPDHAWTRTYHKSLTHTPVLIIPVNGNFEWSMCWQLRGIRPSIF